MRSCTRCGQQKEDADFSWRNKAKNARRNTCKACHNKYVRTVWFENNKEKHRATVRKYKSEHPDRVIAARYNTSREEAAEVLRVIRCEICGDASDLHVDHCHVKGHVRGRLCKRCNWGLGWFRDDAALLRKAAEYVSKDTAGTTRGVSAAS